VTDKQDFSVKDHSRTVLRWLRHQTGQVITDKQNTFVKHSLAL